MQKPVGNGLFLAFFCKYEIYKGPFFSKTARWIIFFDTSDFLPDLDDQETVLGSHGKFFYAEQ